MIQFLRNFGLPSKPSLIEEIKHDFLLMGEIGRPICRHSSADNQATWKTEFPLNQVTQKT